MLERPLHPGMWLVIPLRTRISWFSSMQNMVAINRYDWHKNNAWSLIRIRNILSIPFLCADVQIANTSHRSIASLQAFPIIYKWHETVSQSRIVKHLFTVVATKNTIQRMIIIVKCYYFMHPESQRGDQLRIFKWFNLIIIQHFTNRTISRVRVCCVCLCQIVSVIFLQYSMNKRTLHLFT